MFKYLALVAAAAALRLADDTKNKTASLADEKNKTASLSACVDGKDANGNACKASLGEGKKNATESLGDAKNATAAAL